MSVPDDLTQEMLDDLRLEELPAEHASPFIDFVIRSASGKFEPINMEIDRMFLDGADTAEAREHFIIYETAAVVEQRFHELGFLAIPGEAT